MESDGTIIPNKAHRVSRHVSFQAVVPPSVAFPVNYSGPTLIQTNTHFLNSRQSVVDFPKSEQDESPHGDLKSRFGPKKSTVAAFEFNRDSHDESSLAPFDKAGSNSASLNVPNKKPYYFGNFQLKCKDFSISRRRFFIIALILIFFIVLVLIIIAVMIGISNIHPKPGERMLKQTLEVCESTGCLRIGLFFQTTLAKINKEGIATSCSEASLRTLVKIIWNGETSADVTFESPLATVIDQISQGNLASNSRLKNCALITGDFSVQNPNDYEQSQITISRVLHEVTLTFNSFDDVLQSLHMQYRIPIFFETWAQRDALEIATPNIPQPWDNFILEYDQSRLANELRRYICTALHYTQTIGAVHHVNTSTDCENHNNERINGVYEILARLQEVKF
ncbi:hypothetical protein Aperf_G00000023563 [Anoplocephala perfoliata]